MDIINNLLAPQMWPSGFWESIIKWFAGVGSIAVAIILLTICIKLVLFPLDFWQKRVSFHFSFLFCCSCSGSPEIPVHRQCQQRDSRGCEVQYMIIRRGDDGSQDRGRYAHSDIRERPIRGNCIRPPFIRDLPVDDDVEN